MRQVAGFLGRMVAPIRTWVGRRSPAQLGALAIALAVLISGSLLVIGRDRMLVAVKRGERITADFANAHKLLPVRSKVKIAGVQVGVVTAVKARQGGGTAPVAQIEMKVDKGTRAKLGTAPSAAIRPTTLLGGPGVAVYVDLRPGGDRGRAPDHIALGRTTLPVELDQVLEVLTEEARRGLTRTIRGLDIALAEGGSAALREVVQAAPPTLAAATPVLDALRGEQPDDLVRVVTHLGRAAEVLTDDNDSLEAVVDGLATVASRLQARTPELAATLERLPGTLDVATDALAGLNGTLDRLARTAPAARPAVAQLRALVDEVRPVLSKARPVVKDLRPLVVDARPVLEALGPTARAGEQVLGDLGGAVLERLNGHVIPTLRAPYRPGQPDPTLNSDTVLYQEAAFLMAGLGGIVKYMDQDGHSVAALPTAHPDDLQRGNRDFSPQTAQPTGPTDRPGLFSFRRMP